VKPNCRRQNRFAIAASPRERLRMGASLVSCNPGILRCAVVPASKLSSTPSGPSRDEAPCRTPLPPRASSRNLTAATGPFGRSETLTALPLLLGARCHASPSSHTGEPSFSVAERRAGWKASSPPHSAGALMLGAVAATAGTVELRPTPSRRLRRRPDTAPSIQGGRLRRLFRYFAEWFERSAMRGCGFILSYPALSGVGFSLGSSSGYSRPTRGRSPASRTARATVQHQGAAREFPGRHLHRMGRIARRRGSGAPAHQPAPNTTGLRQSGVGEPRARAHHLRQALIGCRRATRRASGSASRLRALYSTIVLVRRQLTAASARRVGGAA